MRAGVKRPLLLGAGLGLAAALIVGAWALGAGLGDADAAPSEVLVIAEAPAQDGSPSGAMMFLLRREDDSLVAESVDSQTPATLSGTSASTLAELVPFGGGAAVADAYAEAEDVDEAPEWVLLQPQAWTALVDDAGGIEIQLPEDVSTYVNGRLTVEPAGERSLTGDEALGVAAAIPFVEDASAARTLRGALSEALAATVSAAPGGLRRAVAADTASSSLSSAALAEF
jgi:hypothetical protein